MAFNGLQNGLNNQARGCMKCVREEQPAETYTKSRLGGP